MKPENNIISVFGERIQIVFNMKVQIAFERITEKAFDLALLSHAEYRLALYLSSILTGNPETKVTMDTLFEASMEDINLIDKTLNEVMRNWYHIPEAAEKNVPVEEGNGDDSKNL